MAQKKILLVDDAKIFQDIYKNLLMPEGYIVKVAGNGMEALKLAISEKPDLILLDLNMPVMDGFKVLEAVKSNPELSSIHIIVLSSRGVPAEIEKAVNLGADSYLVKATAKPKEVIAKIKSILES
jgi:CheY-like chemotaxis protein